MVFDFDDSLKSLDLSFQMLTIGFQVLNSNLITVNLIENGWFMHSFKALALKIIVEFSNLLV